MDDLDDLLDCEQDLLDEPFADQGVLLCSEIAEFACRVLAQLISDWFVPYNALQAFVIPVHHCRTSQ